MSSHRSGGFKRSVRSALAAVLAAAVPSLIASPALAEKTAEKAAEKTATAKKAHGVEKAPAKAEARKPKKTASRAKGKKTARRPDPEAPKRRCIGAPISIDCGGLERQTLTPLDCHDRPLAAAREALSVLARPWGAQKPALVGAHHADLSRGHLSAVHAHGGPAPVVAHAPGELAPGVRLLDQGLLIRVGAVARRFPGRPISLVSGYRPQSRGSLHQSARALDLRVAGVTNEELVAFCKTLPDTGCGYYPNSSFVHVDVRNPGTGGVTWIDASGPGQAPHYVPSWPLPPEEADHAVLPPGGGSGDSGTVDPADEHADDRDPYP